MPCLFSVTCADIADRLVRADPKRVAALASSTDLIAARLLRLRDIFPKVGYDAVDRHSSCANKAQQLSHLAMDCAYRAQG